MSLGVAGLVLAVRGGRALPALVGGIAARLRPPRRQRQLEAAQEPLSVATFTLEQ